MEKHFVFDRFDYVTLARGEEVHEMLYHEYSEAFGEIVIKTTAIIPELQRGWMGDLTYATRNGYVLEAGKEEECVFECCYHDVLLIKVEPTNEPDELVCWTYTFLKA